MSRATLPCVLSLGLAALLSPPELHAARPRVRGLSVQKVGDTTYFHLRLERPADLKMPPLESGPYSEGQRRQLARLPQLVPQDGNTAAVYQRLDAPHFRPTVGFDATRPDVPIEGLEFVGKVTGEGRAKLLLLYPNGEESTRPEGVKRGEGFAHVVRRARWAEEPLGLDFARAKTVPLPGEAVPFKEDTGYSLRTLWAEGQAARLAVLEALAPDFGFYGFACAATGRKYGVADPVLEAEKRKDPERVHRQLFELTTGTSAITQSLALKRLRDNEGRGRGERNTHVSRIQGIEIAEHPWEKMMAGKKPAPEPLAKLVPHDNWYAHFKDVRKLIELGEFLDQWLTGAARAYEATSRDHQLKERYEKQLCLRSTWMGKTLGPLVLKGVALTGSDPYVREGSDVAILFHVTNRQLFLGGVEQFIKEARKEFGQELRETKEVVNGVTVERFVTPLREVSLHRAVFGDFVVYANSPAGLRRILDTHRGKHKALWDSLDFQYMRTAFPLTDKEEDGFAFLSDAFIRQLVGPASKIKEMRRLEALTSLTMLTHGAMFAAWETGRPPAGHKDLLAAAGLRPEHLYVPEGKAPRWNADRQVAVSEAYNTLHFATPLIELPIDNVTAAEARAYREFRQVYVQMWRQFFDPVGMRFALDKKQVKAEVYILPLPALSGGQFNWVLGGGGPGAGTTKLDPSRFSPRTVGQFVMYNPPRGFFFGDDALGDWITFRVDDDPRLGRLAEFWVRQDLSPSARPDVHFLAEVLALDLPITIGVAGGKEPDFTDLLKQMVPLARAWLGPCEIKERKHRGVPVTRAHFGPKSKLVGHISNELKTDVVTSVTLYHARIGHAWYVGLSEKTLRDLIDREEARKQGKAPPEEEMVQVNSLVYLSPKAAVRARAALQSYLEWETHKRALHNNALWYALHRCNLAADDSPAGRRAAAMKWLGFVPVSPDDAPYAFDARAGEVVNARHGSLRRPQLHPAVAPGSPVAGMLEQFPSLRVDSRFREDGMHSTLTLQRKQ